MGVVPKAALRAAMGGAHMFIVVKASVLASELTVSDIESYSAAASSSSFSDPFGSVPNEGRPGDLSSMPRAQLGSGTRDGRARGV